MISSKAATVGDAGRLGPFFWALKLQVELGVRNGLPGRAGEPARTERELLQC